MNVTQKRGKDLVAELCQIRFKLATALKRLDKLIDQENEPGGLAYDRKHDESRMSDE